MIVFSCIGSEVDCGWPVLSNPSRIATAVERIEVIATLAAIGCDHVVPADPEFVANTDEKLGDAPIARGLTKLLVEQDGLTALVRRCATHTSGGSMGTSDRIIGPYCDVVDALRGLLDRQCERSIALRHATAHLTAAMTQDPFDTLRSVVGEDPDPVMVVVAPSLALPEPQVGRIGTTLRSERGLDTLLLSFGLPPDPSKRRFDTNESFILGGIWHDALHRLLGRLWPPIAAQLESTPALRTWHEDAGATARPLASIIERELKAVLRAQLFVEIGVPAAALRRLSLAAGSRYYNWFAEWVEHRRRDGTPLSVWLTRLPDDLERAVSSNRIRADALETDWINLTLASDRPDPLDIIVPDSWDDARLADVRRNWLPLPTQVVRVTEAGRERSGLIPRRRIALGPSSQNRIVTDVLDAMDLTTPEEADALLVALHRHVSQHGWTIVATSVDDDLAAGWTLESAMRTAATIDRRRMKFQYDHRITVDAADHTS